MAHACFDCVLVMAVRSKDSGIQNSADGSREMLASTPSSSSETGEPKQCQSKDAQAKFFSSSSTKQKIRKGDEEKE